AHSASCAAPLLRSVLLLSRWYLALRDLHSFPTRRSSDLGYMLDHVEVHDCDYNWKTFIEVYLEDYHVEPFHPGLGNFVTCDDLRSEEHTSELQSREKLVCRLLLEKKKREQTDDQEQDEDS